MDYRFYISYFMCSLAVVMFGINFLFIISFVRPGHVVRWLFWMVLINVDLTGENNATCKKFTKSALVSFFLLMTNIVGEETWTYLNIAVLFCSILYFFSCISCSKCTH